MNLQQHIAHYMSTQPESKRNDMEALHKLILELSPECQLWYLDGKDDKGKIVSNPNIGYGEYTIQYADGKTKPFYRIGMSANTSGISVYVMGIQDKTYLVQKFGKDLGKATVTGYCIKFKSLNDIDVDILKAAIQFGFEYDHQINGVK
ncbi:MAG: DUF1801 domain-containing protein [Chitinophagaceae bacterium]|nr:DUF1801 domain-containing protein [Chitinophagaceae bacterium]